MRIGTARRLHLLLLLVSAILRIVLVRSGGQYYWPDEVVYEDSQQIVAALATGDRDAVFERLDRAGPLLFKVIGVVPATLEFVSRENPHVPALFFAAFSVLNIWLIGRIATRLGASPLEALLAATLLALSSSFFYFSRHLLPYDVAMTFALLAIYAGVRPDASARASLRGSCLCGVLAGCSFFTYHGYWTIAGVALLLHVIAARSLSEAMWRTLVSVAGLCALVAGIIGADAALGGKLFSSLLEFAGMITQGNYDEGWRLPVEYLWHAEHGLLIVWMGCILLCLATWRSSAASPRARAGLLGLVVVFMALAVTSTFLHRFVVYGRLVRQLVPFFCLVSAFALARLWESPRTAMRALVPVTMGLLVVQSAFNFSTPLRQVFPDDFEYAYGPSHTSPLIWVNVEHIFPEPRKVTLPEGFVVVHQAAHPLQFLPYQYEGHTPELRHMLRTTDIRMRVIAGPPVK